MPFNLTLDLFTALERLNEAHKINEWFKLILELGFSYTMSFSSACGAALMFHRPTLEAIGEGLVTGAACAVLTWRHSPQTKGLVISLPLAEAKAEMATDTQTITR